MKVIDFEPTPNPAAMKFNVDGSLIEGGSRSFDTAGAAEADPLAKALFATGRVASVFFMPGFVTVNKADGAEWSTLAPTVARLIETTERAAAAGADAVAGAGGDAALARIHQVIDQQIRPALAADGGGLEVLGLQGTTLSIRYQGACGSCPSAIGGTLRAIENLLQAEVDERLTVVMA